MKSALILFAHGSRDPEWAAPFRKLQQRVAAEKPDVAVELAFLEMMPPSLGETIDRLVVAGRERVTIAPLFMAQGAHLNRDLGKLVSEARTRHPDIEIGLLPALGEIDAVIGAISTWLCANA